MSIFLVKGNKNSNFSKDKIPVILIHYSFSAPRFPPLDHLDIFISFFKSKAIVY